MRRVRVAGTAPERRVAAVMRGLGLRYRSHVGGLPGTPDFVLRDAPLAVFVDGCFWHGCPRCFVRPRSNGRWWRDKVEGNRRRDRRKDSALRRLGYSVIHVREHDGTARIARRLGGAAQRVGLRPPSASPGTRR